MFQPKNHQKNVLGLEEPPALLLKGSPAGAYAESKDEEIGGERILLTLHHRSPTTSIFATRVASSTRHCYSYSIQHLHMTGGEWQWDGARQKGASLLTVLLHSLKSGEFNHHPSSPLSQ